MDQARSPFVAVSAHTARQWGHVTRRRRVHNGVDTAAWTPAPVATTSSGSGGWSPRRHRTRRFASPRRAGAGSGWPGRSATPEYFRSRRSSRCSDLDAEYVGPPRRAGPAGPGRGRAPPWSSPRSGTSPTAWSPPSPSPAARPSSGTAAVGCRSSSQRTAAPSSHPATSRRGRGRSGPGLRHGPAALPRPRRVELLPRRHGRRVPGALPRPHDRAGAGCVIGYYAHHQGAGHLTRMQSIAAAMDEPVWGLSSSPAPDRLGRGLDAAGPRRRPRPGAARPRR